MFEKAVCLNNNGVLQPAIISQSKHDALGKKKQLSANPLVVSGLCALERGPSWWGFSITVSLSLGSRSGSLQASTWRYISIKSDGQPGGQLFILIKPDNGNDLGAHTTATRSRQRQPPFWQLCPPFPTPFFFGLWKNKQRLFRYENKVTANILTHFIMLNLSVHIK